MAVQPSRGEIWTIELDPTKGHEQSGTRPGLILSVDAFNHGHAGLVVAAPLTSRLKGIPWHVGVQPPEGGVRQTSYIKCEDIRSLARERLRECWGTVTPQTLAAVEDRVRILLGL